VAAVAELETVRRTVCNPTLYKSGKGWAPTLLLVKERAGWWDTRPENSYAALAVFLGVGTGT
jgi:hypothetical protein